VLLPLLGREVFPLGPDGALGTGLLYAARGVGAGLGPVLAHRWGGASAKFLRRALGPSFLLMAAGYLLLSGAPSLRLAALALALAHCGGSTQWVFSTALLQLTVPGRLQGRIFAVELALLTLVTCVTGYALGTARDAGWDARTLTVVVALAFVPPGLALLALWAPPRDTR
jgi:hypothetical protein